LGFKYIYLNYYEQINMMKYLYLLLLSVIFIPISQVAYGQNILDEIGQAFNNLTTGMMGDNQTNQSASSGSANQSASSGSANQSASSGSANQSASSGSANQSASSGSANQSASSGSANQSDASVGSIQELQNLTSGNQELLQNGTSIAPENNSLGTGLEREQYVESENQSNALSAGSNSSQ
jgi:type IV secretory pathway TrbL component